MLLGFRADPSYKVRQKDPTPKYLWYLCMTHPKTNNGNWRSIKDNVIKTQAATLFAAAYNLVVGVVERGEVKQPQPLRIECLGTHPRLAPLVAFTSPVAMPASNPARI